MEKHMVNKVLMTSQEVKSKFYTVFTPGVEIESTEHRRILEDIERWVVNSTIKDMAHALRWHYNTGGRDFYSMVESLKRKSKRWTNKG